MTKRRGEEGMIRGDEDEDEEDEKEDEQKEEEEEGTK